MFLKNILRAGIIFRRTILRGAMSYTGIPAITQPKNNILIQFYTMSDQFIDSISMFSESDTKIGIDFDVDIIGGLKEFTLQLKRNYEVKLFDQMIVKFFMNNIHWFSGMLKTLPGDDTSNPVIDYKGIGLIMLLEKENVNLLYENVTLAYILNDLIGTQMTNTDIYYDASKINPPAITVVKLELNDKSILSCLDKILEIANTDFNNAEYRYYINENRTFIFESIDKTVLLDSLFEGYEYQKPETKTNINKIVNEIKIYRNQEDSQTTEWIDTISDLDSIANYGLNSEKLVINDYADVDDATYMARYIIERFKNPTKTIKISDLVVEEPLLFGSYNLNNQIQEYNTLLSDCNDLAEWDMFVSNTTVTLESVIVQSGRNCLKIITASGSLGEYIELNLTEQINFPEYLDLWLRQDVAGMFIFFQFYDEYGNTTEYDETPIISESGEYLITESGGESIIAETGSAGVQVNLIEQFNRYSIPIDNAQIKSLKKVRIVFITNDPNTFYIDRIECRSRQYKTNNLVLRKANYKIDKGIFTASCQFGEIAKSGVDDIKELNEDAKTLQSIFTKS